MFWMKCKLCNTDKKLIKRSHIIPDFFYKGIYDERHKVYLANINKEQKGVLHSSSPYEGNILCKDCDSVVIGKYENYTSGALFGGGLSQKNRPTVEHKIGNDGLKYLDVKNLNYNQFKLCILSVIWRISISSLPLFKNMESSIFL